MKNLKSFLKSGFEEIKQFVKFYNQNTEILAFWLIVISLLLSMLVLFTQGNIMMKILSITLSIVILWINIFLAVLYFYQIKFAKQKNLIKIHKFLNKSFKVRTIFLIKIPVPEILQIKII